VTVPKKKGAPKGNQYAKGHDGSAAGREKVYTQERMKEEADALREWAKQPGNFMLKEFAWERGYDPNRIGEFVKESKYFAGVFKEFNDNKPAKIARDAYLGKVDMGWVRYFMPRLCRHSEEDEIWKAAFDRANEDNAIAQQVVAGIVNYADAVKKDKGWQPPEKKS